jgi:hypothetical protein
MKNVSEVVAGLQELFNQVKYFHWQTKSLAQHESLGDAFDDLEDLIDDFVEVAMGKYGRPSTKNQKLEMFDLEDVNIMDWATGVVDYLISFDDVLDETQDTDLLNIRDEMMAVFNKVKYLLTLKESNMKKKKVIKLTEADLQRIVERVINEQSLNKKSIVGSLNSTNKQYIENIIGKLKNNLKTEKFKIIGVDGKIVRTKNNQLVTTGMFIDNDETFKFEPNSYMSLALFMKKTDDYNPTDLGRKQINFGADENGKLSVTSVGL